MLVDVSESGMSSMTFTMKLLEEEKVAVAPGEVFGPGGHGFVRVSLAGEIPEIEEGLLSTHRRMLRRSKVLGPPRYQLSGGKRRDAGPGGSQWLRQEYAAADRQWRAAATAGSRGVARAHGGAAGTGRRLQSGIHRPRERHLNGEILGLAAPRSEPRPRIEHSRTSASSSNSR